MQPSPSRLAIGFVVLAVASPLLAATDRPMKSVVGVPAPIAAGADVTFIVGGDNRPTASGAPLPPVLGRIFDEVALIHPDLVLWSGDTIYGYCEGRQALEAEYQRFFALAVPTGVPLFNTPGNHEIRGNQHCPDFTGPKSDACDGACAEALFRTHFGEIYGSFDIGDIHFVALDTDVVGQEGSIAGDQLEWLKRDLDANHGARAIFVFSHSEFYSSPNIDPDAAH